MGRKMLRHQTRHHGRLRAGPNRNGWGGIKGGSLTPQVIMLHSTQAGGSGKG